jgi:hypothetical protein
MAQRLLHTIVRDTVIRIAICLAAMLALSGCVTSEAPVLGQSQQPFGDGAKFQFYSLRGGAAHDPSLMQLRWNGTRYTAIGPDLHKDNALTFHPLDGNDLVAQVIDGRPDHKVEYAVLRQAAEGVYLVNPVDEDDADAPTRAKFCAAPSGCRVTTAEQVMGLARATAAKRHSRGALAIRIGDDK